MVAMTLDSFIDFLSKVNISTTYDLFNYDYAEEVTYQKTLKGAELREANQDRIVPDYESRRRSFLHLFSWHKDEQPSFEFVLRLFNQVNTYYAENWAMAHLAADPRTFIDECGRLILFKQGKETGFRANNILFGIRQDLDFMDPYRGFKFLRGIAPGQITRFINVWADVIKTARKGRDRALLFAMAIIAAHPLPDGNGRLARIAYSWLIRQWGFGECWLAEDSAGEFLRTGFRLDGTEHLMSALVIELCGGHNRNDFGFGAVRTGQEDELAAETLEEQLRVLGHDDSAIIRCEPFIRLRDHLFKEGHFTERYPRFEALRQVLK